MHQTELFLDGQGDDMPRFGTGVSAEFAEREEIQDAAARNQVEVMEG